MQNNQPQIVDISVASILRIILILGLVYLLVQTFDFLLILITALVIATFVDPFHDFMKRMLPWMPRSVNVVIFFVVAGGLLIGTISFLLPTIADEFVSFLDETQITFLTEEDISSLSSAIHGSDKINDMIQAVVNLEGIKNVLSPLGALIGGLVNGLILLILTLYVAFQERGFEKFLRVILPLKYEGYIVSIWNRTQKKIARWFQFQLLIAVVVAVLTSLLLWVFGVSHAILIGVIAGVFGLAPYGVVIAFIPSAILGMLTGGVSSLIFILLSFLMVQILLDYVIQPLFLNSATGVPSMFIIIAMIIGAKMFGIFGIILAIPVATLCLELLNDFGESKEAVRKEQEKKTKINTKP